MPLDLLKRFIKNIIQLTKADYYYYNLAANLVYKDCNIKEPNSIKEVPNTTIHENNKYGSKSLLLLFFTVFNKNLWQFL